MANYLNQANEPTLASLLNLFKENLMSELNCHQVGEIVSFDPSNQTAEVQIKMLRMINGVLKEYPVLVDCPCVVLSGGKGRLTLPISAGDSCLVLFNDKDIDNWFSGGQSVTPRTERMHNFSDAIALVSVRNQQNKIEDYLADGTELKYGDSTIKLQDNKVTITNGTAQVELSSGVVTITASSVVVNAPTTSFTGAVAITGATTIGGSLTVQGKDIGPNHVHSGVARGNNNTDGVV